MFPEGEQGERERTGATICMQASDEGETTTANLCVSYPRFVSLVKAGFSTTRGAREVAEKFDLMEQNEGGNGGAGGAKEGELEIEV